MALIITVCTGISPGARPGPCGRRSWRCRLSLATLWDIRHPRQRFPGGEPITK